MMRAIALVLLALAAPDPAAFKREYAGEFDGAAGRVVVLAQAIPAEKFAWRPGPGVRSVSEVFVHIAAGNFLLLDVIGGKVKPDALKRNEEMEKTVTGKDQVSALLQRSIDAVRRSFDKATVAELERHVDFFGRDTTVRAVYLRILAHVNEHMGQSVAYARVNGIAPPWSK